MNPSPSFAILNMLPPDSRVYIVVGDKGTYANAYARQIGYARAENAEEEVRAAVQCVLDCADRYEKTPGCAQYAPSCRASARHLYERDVEARVELTGDLEGLTLYLGFGHVQGRWEDVLEDTWTFTGLHYESGYGSQSDFVRRFKAAAEFVAGLEFFPRD